MSAAHRIQALSDWLSALDLQTYAPLFASNDISFELLHEITADDLRDMGISSVGHRRVLVLAIAKLKKPTNPSTQLIDSMLATANEKHAAHNQHQAAANHQHRLITVMFCDLVGSTEISTQLDTEDLQQLLQAYRICLRDVIQKHKGYIAQYLGDGVLV